MSPPPQIKPNTNKVFLVCQAQSIKMTAINSIIDGFIARSSKKDFENHVARLKEANNKTDPLVIYPYFTLYKGASQKTVIFSACLKGETQSSVLVKVKSILNIPDEIAFHETYMVQRGGTHPNLIGMRQMYLWDNLDLYIEMDLCWGHMIDLTIYQNGRLSRTDVRCFLKQITQGLVHLKSKGIIHCDIKPDNILVTHAYVAALESGRENITDGIKICDLECARDGLQSGIKLDPHMETNSVAYRPPEILLCLPYSYEVDVFALGALLTYMINLYNGRPMMDCYYPFLVQNDLQVQLDLLDKIIGPIPGALFNERERRYTDMNGVFNPYVPRLNRPQPVMPCGFDLYFEHLLQSRDPFVRMAAQLIDLMIKPLPEGRIAIESVLMDPLLLFK
jgi:serine/threonine protein kinase